MEECQNENFKLQKESIADIPLPKRTEHDWRQLETKVKVIWTGIVLVVTRKFIKYNRQSTSTITSIIANIINSFVMKCYVRYLAKYLRRNFSGSL